MLLHKKWKSLWLSLGYSFTHTHYIPYQLYPSNEQTTNNGRKSGIVKQKVLLYKINLHYEVMTNDGRSLRAKSIHFWPLIRPHNGESCVKWSTHNSRNPQKSKILRWIMLLRRRVSQKRSPNFTTMFYGDSSAKLITARQSCYSRYIAVLPKVTAYIGYIMGT